MNLTTPEVIFLQEHLRSCNSMTGLLQFAAGSCQNQQLRSLCQQMARDHQHLGSRFAGMLNQNM